MVGEILPEGRNFRGGDVPGMVVAVFPSLEFVIGADADRAGSVRGAPGVIHFAELAPFHGGDGGDLLKEGLGIGCLVVFHFGLIPRNLGIVEVNSH